MVQTDRPSTTAQYQWPQLDMVNRSNRDLLFLQRRDFLFFSLVTDLYLVPILIKMRRRNDRTNNSSNNNNNNNNNKVALQQRWKARKLIHRGCRNNHNSTFVLLLVLLWCCCSWVVVGEGETRFGEPIPKENIGNGILDVLWKFQEQLRGGQNNLPTHAQKQELQRQLEQQQQQQQQQQHQQQLSNQRRLSNRRLLFQHTLETHYSQFLPNAVRAAQQFGDGAKDDDRNGDDSMDLHRHQQQQQQQHVYDQESWMDERNQCVLFPEDGNAYWTYHLCPKSYVTQVHLQPKRRNEDGSIAEWEAQPMHKLGIYTDDESARWPYPKDDNDDDDDDGNDVETEYYVNGDTCTLSTETGVRATTKRRTLVVYDNDCQPSGDAQLSIESVSEPKPCQYLVRVCHRKEPQQRTNQQEAEKEEKDTMTPQETVAHDVTSAEEAEDAAPSVDDMERTLDIQNVVNAYAHLSGIDQSSMSTIDGTTSLKAGKPHFPPSRKESNRRLIRRMFEHAYDSYMYNAFPNSELKPLTCRKGTFGLVKLPALTLIDALDTLVVMQNYTEFARSVERLRKIHEKRQVAVTEEKGDQRRVPITDGGLFATNQNVSVFETNIRVLGGLLSAHQLALAFVQDRAIPQSHVFGEDGGVLMGPIVEQAAPARQPERPPPSDGPDGTCIAASDLTQECDLSSKSDDKVNQCSKKKNATDDFEAGTVLWTYDGFLLEIAHDLGKRMLPSFDTKTGIPYGTVNLLDGIPPGETTIASLAGGGTLSLEFELLSRLTGDNSFGNAAKLAARALWMRRSKLDLFGKHINIERGEWTETLSGVGSNSDSFYEYLVKHYTLFPEDDDFWTMFVVAYKGVQAHSRLGQWYADVDMNVGVSGATRRVFESLMAFYPGMQILIGELGPAARTLNSFMVVREFLGMLPERFNYGQWRVDGFGGLHPLRPELLESCYFMHKATQGINLQRNNSETDSFGWLWAADYALHALQRNTWTKCGYASVKEVSPTTSGGVPSNKKQKPKLANEMPSFFLSETLKYLYLTFDDDNILHQDVDRQWVFTTEAHPIHHVPKKRPGKEMSEVERFRSQAKDLLRRRLQKKRSSTTKSRINADGEKWAERSHSSTYLRDIAEAEQNIKKSRLSEDSNTTHAQALVDSWLIHPHLVALDEDHEHGRDVLGQEPSNRVHRSVTAAGIGDGWKLTRACPNFHSPSLLWMHALNGGAIDYADVFVSSMSDDLISDTIHGTGMLSAPHALALHASGLFLGQLPARPDACPVDSEGAIAPKGADANEPVPEGTQRFEMGGDMGHFDLSVFEDGDGFFIKSSKTGGTVVVTVVNGEEQRSDDPYIMVVAETPAATALAETPGQSATWALAGMSWKTVFNQRTAKQGEPQEDIPDSERTVIVANSLGKSFECRVDLLRRTTSSADDDANLFFPIDDVPVLERERLIRSFPCAPALFGPADVTKLVKSNGAIAEGVLIPPSRTDPNGCGSEPSRAGEFESVVSVAHRGTCTFESKVMNHKRTLGSKGVVVINSGLDELFLMSKGSGKKAAATAGEEPLSVLVTGRDGKELMQLYDQWSGSSDTLVAAIVLSPQNVETDQHGNVAHPGEDMTFPIVKASRGAVQVFASGGWGVHAMERPERNPRGDREWQLYLLQHEIRP